MTTSDETVRVLAPAVFVLVGPAGAGKSHWSSLHFAANEVVSSDALRASVGTGESDLDGSDAAFDLLHRIVAERCRRRLSSVVDTLGLDRDLRASIRAIAAAHDVPCHAVVFDTPAELCRTRNAERAKRVPASVLAQQLARMRHERDAVLAEPFAGVHVVAADRPAAVRSVLADAAVATASDRIGAVRFGLHLSSFPGPASTLRERMAGWARAAEAVGFDSIWVMDHFRQIPQVGRDWDDMPESVAALSYLAGVTERVSLGALVHCVTHRNPGVLGKSLATLDVLSGGRAFCGLGIGWFGQEHLAYGLDFPTVRERYALLEDTLRFLPMLWGKGAPSFEGARYAAPQAMGYPRPLRGSIPMLVGGSGERRTLRLAAQYADACNLFGTADVVRHKVDVLHRHCDAVGRDPSQVSVTHLSTALVGDHPDDLNRRLEALRVPRRVVGQLNPGTVDDHIARVANLSAAGTDHVIVSMPAIDSDTIERYGRVIAAFR